MNNYEEIVGIKTRYENSSEAELNSYLYSFQSKWVLQNNKSINIYVNRALENFGLSESYSIEDLEINYKKCLYNVVYLQQQIANLKNESEFSEIQVSFNKIFESDEYSPTSEIFLINLFCCIFD